MFKNLTGFKSLVKREILRYFVVFSQTIVPPLVSSALFMFIFGLSIGRNISLPIKGLSYLDFMVPGLVMMHLIESSYANTSSSLSMSRWHNHIQEVLLSPLSYFEMVSALLIGGLTRGILAGTGVYCVSLLFTKFVFYNFLLVAYFFVMATFIFSALGLIAALWADSFDKLSVWSTFVISPLVYFGGVFHSMEMLPSPLQAITKLNPMFYLVNGLRFGMLGKSDAPVAVSMLLAALLAASLFLVVEKLFRIGYKLRS